MFPLLVTSLRSNLKPWLIVVRNYYVQECRVCLLHPFQTTLCNQSTAIYVLFLGSKDLMSLDWGAQEGTLVISQQKICYTFSSKMILFCQKSRSMFNNSWQKVLFDLLHEEQSRS